MRPYAIGGLILIILGILTLSIRSVTYFTTDHVVGPLGFFSWDVSPPHTVFFSPFAGIVALALGVFFIVIARRPRAI